MTDSHIGLLLRTATGPLQSRPQDNTHTHSPALITTQTVQRFKCKKPKSTAHSAYFGDMESKQPQRQEPQFCTILETLVYSLSNYAITPIPVAAWSKA
jgi:hypothetical protein